MTSNRLLTSFLGFTLILAYTDLSAQMEAAFKALQEEHCIFPKNS